MSTRRFRGRLALAGVIAGATAVAALPALSASAATSRPALRTASCPSCGHNLIRNPGAEAGKGADSDVVVKVPDWKQAGGFTAAQYAWSGGDLSATSPGPKHRGKNYFYGGPDAATSTGTQTATLSSGGIAGGTVTYSLSGWLGGYDSQGDYAVLSVSFETSTGTVLSSAKIGPVTEAQRKGTSELLDRRTTGSVPSGARQVAIELKMVREEGSDNDGLADDLSLVLSDK